MLATLDSERFIDQSPYQVYATLLDEGVYLCSVSTMYRLLCERAPVRVRRNQLTHPSYAVPRLEADAPKVNAPRPAEVVYLNRRSGEVLEGRQDEAERERTRVFI